MFDFKGKVCPGWLGKDQEEGRKRQRIYDIYVYHRESEMRKRDEKFELCRGFELQEIERKRREEAKPKLDIEMKRASVVC